MRRSPVVLAAPLRLNYFHGRLLTAEDLSREQEYHLSARRRLNLLALGAGVASGLRISSTRGRVRISAGLAIDRFGREIIVPEPVEVPPGADRSGGRMVVFLAYVEEAVEPLPVNHPSAGEATRFSAVRETYRVWLSSARPPAGDPAAAVVIGVVKRTKG